MKKREILSRSIRVFMALTIVVSAVPQFVSAVASETYIPMAIQTFNGHKYVLYDDSLSWYEAKEFCESMSGHLCTITSDAEQNAVERLLMGSKKMLYLIGGEKKNNIWEWVTGEDFDYSFWDDGEPNNIQNKEDKLMIYGNRGNSNDYKWNDTLPAHSDTKYAEQVGFICEYDENIAGIYEGWYYANQGQTGLTLTINDDGTGLFEFYNMPGKTNAKNGSYTVKVSRDDERIIVEGDEWIDKPSTYSFVSLSGTIENDRYSGKVNNNWDFELYKNNESYQEVSDSVFANHKYERFDEALTWSQAKERCEALGGHLVTITSEEEQQYIEELIQGGKNGYWIGGSYNGSRYNWITGEEMIYTHWDNNQPDQDGGDENRMMIFTIPNPYGSNSFAGGWNDLENEGDAGETYSLANMGYICEWETWSESAEWSTPELQKAADADLIPDVLVGKDMTQPITRGEFAAVSVKLFEAMTGGKTVMSSECQFDDISKNENRNYILRAYNIGAVRGYSDTEYAPDDLLQREQLAAMLCRVYKRSEWPEWTLDTDDNYTINYSGVRKFDDDGEISEYAKPSVYFLVKYGVLSGIGDNLFAPKNSTPAQEAQGYANATREQAVVMSLRSFENFR